MPDLTLCSSKECPVRDACYRSQAKPGQFQSYSNFEYTCNEDNGFSYYIQLELNEIKQRSNIK